MIFWLISIFFALITFSFGTVLYNSRGDKINYRELPVDIVTVKSYVNCLFEQ